MYLFSLPYLLSFPHYPFYLTLYSTIFSTILRTLSATIHYCSISPPISLLLLSLISSFLLTHLPASMPILPPPLYHFWLLPFSLYSVPFSDTTLFLESVNAQNFQSLFQSSSIFTPPSYSLSIFLFNLFLALPLLPSSDSKYLFLLVSFHIPFQHPPFFRLPTTALRRPYALY